ncbi:DUF2752 domain-containing protein [Cellulomonas denverensis]|uniref:DUF2752 domain-containing protein n=1 Tax=Cellulomonas denverensis TaxID=264297 RepID=A0A7X6QY61_9CELL|nr:DUF2752 domain-containing protein [Cellulomonas denverensis]NKY21805.1 DUF2752 domain-containing protein [Cellulomonas denverensis]GIG24306.1 membrane protein [Cellulomonas denverensis]
MTLEPQTRATAPTGVVARLRAARVPLLSGAAVGAAGLALVLRDPHQSGSWGACPLYLLTGWYCPACGGLRATHDVLTGDLAGAWAMNPVWVLLIPLVVGLWARWTVRAAQGRSAALGLRDRWYVLGLILLVLYGIARNVPAWAGALAPPV